MINNEYKNSSEVYKVQTFRTTHPDFISFNALITFSTWPLTATFFQIRAILPSGSIRNVERMTPCGCTEIT